MHKFIYLLSLFSSLFIFSQEATICVEYGLTVQPDKDLFKDNATMLQLVNNAISNAKNETFTLLINKNNSKFYHNEMLSTDGNSRIPLFANYSGKTYLIDNVLFVESMLLGNNMFVKKSITKDWKITNETKMIDSYKCYKATNIFQVITPKKVFNHPVTAWFCPDLPYNHGPNGYGNLPGLILELQQFYSIYGVKKITLNSSKSFSVNEIAKIKLISEKEKDEILEKGILEDK
ncbi:GLPGLI family protein [Flavobacterium sp. j3]|uniref:GLPGLI family protein n=1 Tax=Flavobacterium aureirubrum TaxID=3133147 RepID=A0ABU9N8V0_9FLAO